MLGRRSLSRHGRQESMNRRGSISTSNLSISLTLMNYKTVKEIRTELEHRGGRLLEHRRRSIGKGAGQPDAQSTSLIWPLRRGSYDRDPQGDGNTAFGSESSAGALELLEWANKTDLGATSECPGAVGTCPAQMTLHDLGLMCLLLSPPLLMMSIFLWTFAAGG